MKKNHKRLAATVAILFLVALYIFTFITAFLKIENWNRLFLASAAATVFVPILVWIFIFSTVCRQKTDHLTESLNPDKSDISN